MNGFEAIKLAAETGVKVRQPDWCEGYFIEFNSGGILSTHALSLKAYLFRLIRNV